MPKKQVMKKEVVSMAEMEDNKKVITQEEIRIVLSETTRRWCGGLCPCFYGKDDEVTSINWKGCYIVGTEDGPEKEDEEYFRKVLKKNCLIYRLVSGDKAPLISEYHEPSHRTLFRCPFIRRPLSCSNKNFEKLIGEARFSL